MFCQSILIRRVHMIWQGLGLMKSCFLLYARPLIPLCYNGTTHKEFPYLNFQIMEATPQYAHPHSPSYRQIEFFPLQHPIYQQISIRASQDSPFPPRYTLTWYNKCRRNLNTISFAVSPRPRVSDLHTPPQNTYTANWVYITPCRSRVRKGSVW